jgi:Fic family protein
LRRSGQFSGSVAHIKKDDREQITVSIISEEAHQTSEIEGEILDRDSLQCSIRRHFGLEADQRKIPPAEAGISELMMDLYRDYHQPLTHQRLFDWHRFLTQGRRDLKQIGTYRDEDDPMQVVSGSIHDPVIHYEAPPSVRVHDEMEAFLSWYEKTAPDGAQPLPILTRAAIAHLYFVVIHPFEDGNGRIARAISEKAVAEGLGYPALIPLSQTINRSRKTYYQQLAKTNHTLDIGEWVNYFSQSILESLSHAQNLVDFLIKKTKFYDQYREKFNPRQEKAIARLFREGPDGFVGGLTAEKYCRITGATRPTATRDLQDLVQMKALTRTGKLKGTRYQLDLTEVDR